MESPDTASAPPSSIYRCASAAFTRTWAVVKSTKPPASEQINPKLPSISEGRLLASLHEKSPKDQIPDFQSLKDASKTDQTYLYLAYGSNLAASTFRGVRGIRPLAALNVVVPELVMTFDLAGVPYTEPCFANTAYRSPSPSPSSPQPSSTKTPSEKFPLLLPTNNANPSWPKGLVGVVYEVTPSDYAHIIATEGGGASYHDVLVTCHPLPPATTTVPAHPTTPPFKAHTLYSPISPPGSKPPKDGSGGRFSRPDPEYAQPSRRYLDLIRTGAEEHDIPREYREYLDELQPYTITTQGQRWGRFVFSVTWLPVIRAVLALNRVFSDEQGRSPRWLVSLLGVVFVGVWASYDGWMKGVFGDGERTIGDGGEERQGRRRLVKRRREGVEMEVGEKEGWVDEV
ncbi:MAG: hypothetical protein LQ338_001282 [Usnochroma carphineum]|nr:MAG: hypothetical protein LQ338_001282 [Usnochroma carphineum]